MGEVTFMGDPGAVITSFPLDRASDRLDVDCPESLGNASALTDGIGLMAGFGAGFLAVLELEGPETDDVVEKLNDFFRTSPVSVALAASFLFKDALRVILPTPPGCGCGVGFFTLGRDAFTGGGGFGASGIAGVDLSSSAIASTVSGTLVDSSGTGGASSTGAGIVGSGNDG